MSRTMAVSAWLASSWRLNQKLRKEESMTMVCYLGLGSRLTMYGLMVLLYAETFFLQVGGKSPAGPPMIRASQESSRFIVAFELTEENGFNFTWPFESMRPSSYETVVMVVEKMPRVRDETNGGESEPLIASRDLKINGRRQKPYRVANKQSFFLVKLDQGRLRLLLLIPSGMSLDPEHNVARIKLYEQ